MTPTNAAISYANHQNRNNNINNRGHNYHQQPRAYIGQQQHHQHQQQQQQQLNHHTHLIQPKNHNNALLFETNITLNKISNPMIQQQEIINNLFNQMNIIRS